MRVLWAIEIPCQSGQCFASRHRVLAVHLGDDQYRPDAYRIGSGTPLATAMSSKSAACP
jgi:predicted glutamine amidotransferase